MSTDKLAWVFDDLPPSRARRGGDPASHVFRQDITHFVREVIQNANDQALESPEVHFRFVELEGAALHEFFAALRWKDLEAHLRAAAQTRGGRNLAQFLEDLDRRQRLVLLCVEDRGTVGLTGDELEGESHFRALCKDTLFSHKRSEGAGGSYGLGKSVLWAFSGLSTVLFNSMLSQDPKGKRSPRFIGRAELPSHSIGNGPDARWLSGPGWFGLRRRSPQGDLAESVWDRTALDAAASLRVQRSEAHGTSLLIAGFRDPTTDEDTPPRRHAENIRIATARDFWPALTMPGRPLAVWVATAQGGRPIGEGDLTDVRAFVDCYAARLGEGRALEAPGDVAVSDVPFDVPARKDGSVGEVSGHVRLCVRLAEADDPSPLVGHVALFRKPGMVVRYWDRRSLALGQRPFHAVLACGEARHPEAPTAHDHAIERFLRAAEPPGHDEWLPTAALKAEYKRGYAKALDALWARVNEELRRLVIARPRQGAEGPDRLRRRFPIGQRGGSGSEPSAFHFARLAAAFRGGRWVFSGNVRPAIEAPSWWCAIRLVELAEDGSEVFEVPIASLRAGEGALVGRLEAGRALVEPPAGTMEIDFAGESVELPTRSFGRGELSLEVSGRVEVRAT